uniref:Uncharacterized protein n=1 Tax=Arundo donax TaxID=35708 RepID=A0A0A9A4G9_ARUDO
MAPGWCRTWTKLGAELTPSLWCCRSCTTWLRVPGDAHTG